MCNFYLLFFPSNLAEYVHVVIFIVSYYGNSSLHAFSNDNIYSWLNLRLKKVKNTPISSFQVNFVDRSSGETDLVALLLSTN